MRHAARLVMLMVLAVGAIAACGPKAPPPPLLTRVADDRGRYGYDERVIDASRVEISYFAPIRPMPPGAVYRAPHVQRSIDLAADLALWRAAQIARARNAARFTVATRRTDVVVDRYPGGYVADPFFGAPFPYAYRHRGPTLYPAPYGFPYYGYEPPRAYGRAVVRLQIYFGALPGRRGLSTFEVIDRMTRRYRAANPLPARGTDRP